jgi:hypothetical protein
MMAILRGRPYPEVLPVIDQTWLVWNDCVVRKMLEAVYTNKNHDEKWSALPVIADALEDAGCEVPDIYNHFRECHHGLYKRGCWERQCWLLNHMLGKEQPLVASFKFGRYHTEDTEATVINPGAWWGSTWLLYVGDCMSPPMYIIEAEHFGEVEEIFVCSEYGEYLHVNPDDEYDNKDYGFEFHKGDQICGKVIQSDGWYDLQLNYLGKGDEFRRIEPSLTDGGILYDGESIMVEGVERRRSTQGDQMPHECVYHGPGLPIEGISPLRYHRKTKCLACDKEFFPELSKATWDSEEYCSLKCYLEQNDVDFAVPPD